MAGIEITAAPIHLTMSTMSHSQMLGSSLSPVASCEAASKFQSEGSALPATGDLTSPAVLDLPQSPEKINHSAAEPKVNVHTNFATVSPKGLYSPVTPTSASDSTESGLSISSSLNATQPVSPLSNKRAAFSNKHMRSKSSHFPGTMGSPHSPLLAITPNSPTRMPLFRSTSLPTVPQRDRTRERFLSSFGAPPSPSLINTTSFWRNGMPIPTASEGPKNFKMRERSPSRRSPPSGYYSTSPKSHYSPLHHHSPRELRWSEDTYPSSVSTSPSLCSSGPSTPSSIRSRSPSISSLETIPDSPDAEAEALEAERLAEEARKLAITEEEEEEEEEEHASILMTRSASSPTGERTYRRRSQVGLDGFGGFTLPTLRSGTSGLSAEEKRRKRWSVCGGEKRADLELETIWEDRVVAAQSPPQSSLIGIGGNIAYEYRGKNGFGSEMI